MNEDKSVRYHRQTRRIRVASVALVAAVLVALQVTGVSHALWRLVWHATHERPRDMVHAVYAYGAALYLVLDLCLLPLAYAGHLLDRRYELSLESTRVWARARLRAFVMTLVVVAGFAAAVYLPMIPWPYAWWLVTAAIVAAVTILNAFLLPVLFLRWAFPGRPLDRPSLVERLEGLARRAGVPIMAVHEWTLGAQSRRANAALVGVGRGRRLMLSDTLLESHSDDEIEVILAHEIAHLVHKDIPRGMALDLLIMTGALAVTAIVLGLGWRPLGLAAANDPGGLPIVLLCVGAVRIAATPYMNAVSRRRERRADRFALSLTSRPDAFISAMRRLGAQNLADPDPSPVHVLFFHTHPPLGERIAAARAFAENAGRPDPVGG